MPKLLETPKTESNGLTLLEKEVIGLFVHYAQILSLPKSLGEIFGLLFCTDTPLSLDVIVNRLHISKGSASQGLRILRGLNAISIIYIEGDRRDHYVPETRLRNLFTGILRERIQPQLQDARERLQRLQQYSQELPPESELAIRIKRLQAWNDKAARLLPFVTQMVEP